MQATTPSMRAVPPAIVRWSAMALCLAVSIPGMIVSSIGDNLGAAITFGTVGAIASLCLIAVTAVVVDPSPMRPIVAAGPAVGTANAGAAGRSPTPDLEVIGAELERRITALVEHGADEREVREAVRVAVHLARGR
jgi:hypothetical protein